MFVHLFLVLEHNRSLSYCFALKQSLITASTLHQRLLLANSWQDVSAQNKKTVFFRVKTFLLLIRQFLITVYQYVIWWNFRVLDKFSYMPFHVLLLFLAHCGRNYTKDVSRIDTRVRVCVKRLFTFSNSYLLSLLHVMKPFLFEHRKQSKIALVCVLL